MTWTDVPMYLVWIRCKSYDQTLLTTVVATSLQTELYLSPRRTGLHQWPVYTVQLDSKAQGHTYDSCVWLEWVIFPFAFVMANIYYRSDSNPVAVLMSTALASLIEGHWCIWILLFLVKVFIPSNFYALLYSAPTYVKIYIFPYLGYWIGNDLRLLIVVYFIVAHQ